MRKVLNILQSTWMAYKDVTEENVYNCVGHPTPEEIKSIINWLLSTEDFKECYESILFIKKNRIGTFDGISKDVCF